MTLFYRETDPVSGRWIANTGGIDLSAFQIDQNFYELVSRIATLESNESFTVSIDYITVSGNSLTFHMTNHTLQGPFTISVATFTDRGAWMPFTVYAVNDTFSINGTLYDVLFPHTSAATFDPNANDGMGHNYYKAMLSLPGNSLPTGGAVDQVLSKSTSADYVVTWSYKLPTGGNTRQYLRKNSNTNQDALWHDFEGLYAPPPSPAGSAGQVVATIDGTASNTEWISVVYAPPPSPAGQPGQVVATVTGSPQHTEWLTLRLSGLNDVNVTEGSGIDGYFLKFDNATLKWIASPVTQLSTITDVIEYVIDGGGASPTTGLKGVLAIPFNCTITAAELLADQTGSIVVDIWKCTYTQYNPGTHPVSGDSICSSTPPTITSTYKSGDTTLSGWTTSITAGDLLAFNVNSVTTIQRVTLALTVSRTVP